MPRLSITNRLTLLFAVSSAAIMITVGVVLAWAMEAHFKDLDVAEFNGKLELIRHAIDETRTPEANATLPRRLSDALIGHHTLSVKVSKPDREHVFSLGEAHFTESLLNNPVKAQEISRSMLKTWSEGDHAFHGVAVSISFGYTVALGMSIAQHQAFIGSFQRTLVIAVGLGVLLSSILAWFMTRKGLSPLHDIARIAGGISAERLNSRLPIEVVPVEIKDLAAAFNKMLSRLEDSFRRLSYFSSDIAHELRTPVNNLMTATNVALTKARSADEYRETLYSNLEEYHRLSRMIDDMLFLAKADNGLLMPHKEAVDLAAEVHGLFAFYEALAEEKNIVLSSSGEGVAQGDRLMLQRALSNLLSNAIRHTPVGGTIRIDMESAGSNKIAVTVQNSGAPIPGEHLSRIFDRFYRVDPSRQRSSDGAGLGLAITKSIIEAHGGSIIAISGDSKTCFRLQLLQNRDG